MVANASSVRTQILIGDDLQDWSSTLETLDVGWSKRDRSGWFFIDGTLVLDATLYPPESMDARKNPDRWKRGQKIIVNVDLGSGWVKHPLGYLYILKEPLPPHPGNPKITIKVGCLPRLRDYKQPDADNSFLTPGQSTNRGDIIKNILSHGANIDFDQIINDWPLSAPIPKQDGGSFVTQAGEIAYAALQALYQDNAGVIRLRSLKTTSENPIITVSVGGFFKGNYEELGAEPCEETSYEPLEGSETPSDLIKAVGNYKSTSSGLGTQITEIWEYAPAQVISSNLQGIIVSKHTKITDSTFPRQRIVQETIEMPLALINATAWPNDPTLSLASDSVETYTYEGSETAKLINIIKDTKKPFVSAMPDYWNALDSTNKNANKNLIIYAEKTITEWQYGVYTQPVQSASSDPLSTTSEQNDQLYQSSEVPSKQIVTTYETIGAIVPDEGLLSNADQLSISQIQTTQWINIGNESAYRKIESTDTAIGKGFSNATIAGGTATQRANLKLSVINTNNTISVSNSGQNNPPAPERAPAVTNEKETPIQGVAKFKTAGTQEQPRERVIQVKYVTDSDQLSQIAQVEGSLLIGKRLGQRIQVPFVQAFINHPQPDPQIIAIEPDGTTYIFLADGIEYSHTPTKAVVGLDGIWIGTLPSQNGSPLNYSPGVLVPPTPDYGVVKASYISLESDSNNLAVLPPSEELGINLYGGIILGGSVTVLPYDTLIPANISLVGGVIVGGSITTALASNLYGGVVIGGSITTNSAASVSVIGGLVIGGSITITTIDNLLTGGLIIGGSTTVVVDSPITGGLIIGGSLSYTLATNVDVIGGVVIGGNVNLASVDNAVIGGLIVGGSTAQTVITPVIGGVVVGGSVDLIVPRVPLTFTVTQSSSNPAGSQSSLTDNTTTTGAGTNSNTPAYIQLDLGANYTISKLIVAAGSITTFGSTATTLNASSIKYSTDNSSFSTAASITGMSDTANATGLYQAFTGGNNSARYWRIERSTGVLGASEFQPVGTQSFSYPTTYTYVSNGDTNGLLYALGYSTFGTGYYSWSNPAVIGTATYTASASVSGSTNLYNLSDRNNSTILTTGSSANQTITIDLGAGRSFRCDSYTLRSSSNTNQYPRNWKIRGSNDNSTYTDIDVRSSNTTISAASTWYNFTCNQSNTNSYRYIQFQITGTNSGGFNTIDLSEWEFYGVLS